MAATDEKDSSLKQAALDLFTKWLSRFEDERDAIALENDRVGTVARNIAGDRGVSQQSVYIFLVTPLHRGALVQRGVRDLVAEPRMTEADFTVSGNTFEIMEHFGHSYEIYLAALMPLSGSLCEAALKSAYFGGHRGAPHTTLWQPRTETTLISIKTDELDAYVSDWPLSDGDDRPRAKCVKALEKRFSAELKRDGSDTTYLVAVPCTCWGQQRAICVYPTRERPTRFPRNVGHLFEALAGERFVEHCTSIANPRDEAARYVRLLEGCAQLWKPQRVLALDENRVPICLGGFGAALGDAFDDRLEFKYRPAGARPHPFESEDIVFSCRPSLDRSERAALFTFDGAPAAVQSFERTAAVLFPQLRYLVWRPDGEHVRILPSAEVKEHHGVAVGKVIARGMHEMHRRLQEADTLERGLVADLSASFSHRYVKEATYLDTLALELATQVSTKSAEVSQAARSFRIAVGNYRREMELFSQIAQGTTLFNIASESELQESGVFLFRPILEGLIGAFVIAGVDGEFSTADRWAKLTGSSGSSQHELLSIYREVSTKGGDKYQLGSYLSALAKAYPLPRISVWEEWRDTTLRIPTSDAKGILVSCLSKVFFEVFFNALRGLLNEYWVRSVEERPRCTYEPTVRIELGSDSQYVTVKIANTAYQSLRESPAEIERAKARWTRWLRRESEVARPNLEGGIVGGWGLYGNQVIARMITFQQRPMRFSMFAEWPAGVNDLDELFKRPFVSRVHSEVAIPRAFVMEA